LGSSVDIWQLPAQLRRGEQEQKGYAERANNPSLPEEPSATAVNHAVDEAEEQLDRQFHTSMAAGGEAGLTAKGGTTTRSKMSKGTMFAQDHQRAQNCLQFA